MKSCGMVVTTPISKICKSQIAIKNTNVASLGFIPTQLHGTVLNIPSSYSGGHEFKPQTEDRPISRAVVVVFNALRRLYNHFFPHRVIKTQTERSHYIEKTERTNSIS